MTQSNLLSGKASVSSLATPTALARSTASGQHVIKRKRKLPGTPDPDAEVIALSPQTLMATNRFICEICERGFQRDQNLQLHRRGHNLSWKLTQRTSKEICKRVYICPEETCVHHNPARALGDLTGIKKHYCRKHGSEKKWKCDTCSKKYAVQSDWKAHTKICATRTYRCHCGENFSKRNAFVTHQASFCGPLGETSIRDHTPGLGPLAGGPSMASNLSHMGMDESGSSAQWGQSGGLGQESSMTGSGTPMAGWPQYNLGGNLELIPMDSNSPYLMQSASIPQHGSSVSNMSEMSTKLYAPQAPRDSGMMQMHPTQGRISSASGNDLPGMVCSGAVGQIGSNTGMDGDVSDWRLNFVGFEGGSRGAPSMFESKMNLQQQTSTPQISATALLQKSSLASSKYSHTSFKMGSEVGGGGQGSLGAFWEGPNQQGHIRTTPIQPSTSVVSGVHNSYMVQRPEHPSPLFQRMGTTLQSVAFESGQGRENQHWELTNSSPNFIANISDMSYMYPRSTIPLHLQQGNEGMGFEQQHYLGQSQGQQRIPLPMVPLVGKVEDVGVCTRDFLGVQAIATTPGKAPSTQYLQDSKSQLSRP